MRQILVDYARVRKAQKRPSSAQRVNIEDLFDLGEFVDGFKPDVIDVHHALEALEKKYPDYAQALEFRYFLGLKNEEGAAAMGSSVITFRRRCDAAIEFLRRHLVAKNTME